MWRILTDPCVSLFLVPGSTQQSYRIVLVVPSVVACCVWFMLFKRVQYHRMFVGKQLASITAPAKCLTVA